MWLVPARRVVYARRRAVGAARIYSFSRQSGKERLHGGSEKSSVGRGLKKLRAPKGPWCLEGLGPRRGPGVLEGLGPEGPLVFW